MSKEILIWKPSITDAINELKEIKEKSEGDNNNNDDEQEEADDEDFDDEDFDDDDDEETLTAEELVVRPSVIALAKLSVMVLEKTSTSVLVSPKEMTVTQMEEFIKRARETSTLVDEMICSVYSPQDRAVVRKNARALSTHLLDLAQKTLDHLPTDDTSKNYMVLKRIIDKINEVITNFP